ncbi:MAG: lipid-A-disaccharide synthase [Cyanobacteriota bacterium]|nr:lipid-A-disaccharide synthase [Cyanobacteriota bacterium]
MVRSDILILSNGPGEIATWVRPVVKALRQRLPNSADVRISLILSPCVNASGREAEMAASLGGLDRVQGAQHFFPFLLLGKTATDWDWSPQGVVVFLGGDQIYPVLIGRRLGYRTIIYAEWEARWHRWVDRVAAMTPAIVDQAPPQFRHRCEVIGDLMTEVETDGDQAAAIATALNLQPDEPLIGLMPGSKPAKLRIGLPFCLATATALHQQRPQTRFVIPVAPMLSLEALTQFADPHHNPDCGLFEGVTSAHLVQSMGQLPRLRTAAGLEILLWTSQPAYDLLAQLALCLTTVGANTAELGALGIPMMVVLPTQKLEVMKAWDGIPGLLANLPLVGDPLARLINRLVLRKIYQQGRLFAWPNLWAQRSVVPELIGPLQPRVVADQLVDYLDHPDRLAAMAADLRSLRGTPGAAAKLATLVVTELGLG